VTAIPPPYVHVIQCDVCKAQLTLTALRDDAPRTSTTLEVPCPACHKETEVVIPLSVIVSSVQVVFYQRPPEKPTPRQPAAKRTER